MSTYEHSDHEDVDNGPAYKVIIGIVIAIMIVGTWGTIRTVL